MARVIPFPTNNVDFLNAVYDAARAAQPKRKRFTLPQALFAARSLAQRTPRGFGVAYVYAAESHEGEFVASAHLPISIEASSWYRVKACGRIDAIARVGSKFMGRRVGAFRGDVIELEGGRK